MTSIPFFLLSPRAIHCGKCQEIIWGCNKMIESRLDCGRELADLKLSQGFQHNLIQRVMKSTNWSILFPELILFVGITFCSIYLSWSEYNRSAEQFAAARRIRVTPPACPEIPSWSAGSRIYILSPPKTCFVIAKPIWTHLVQILCRYYFLI